MLVECIGFLGTPRRLPSLGKNGGRVSEKASCRTLQVRWALKDELVLSRVRGGVGGLWEGKACCRAWGQHRQDVVDKNSVGGAGV